MLPDGGLLSSAFFLLSFLVEPQSGRPVTIPTQFTENMVYACPVTESGITLKFYTDSGGGQFIYQSVAEKFHLPKTQEQVDGKSEEEVILPAFRPGSSVPPPLGRNGKLLVLPDTDRLPIFDSDLSGLLGQHWFSGRVWTWDYPGRRLQWRAAADVPVVTSTHRVPLGFKTTEGGQRDNSASFPRIQAEIDGETLDLLFDTGASTVLTPDAVRLIADGHAAHRATSFISQSVFERWHRAHPDWKIIEHAEEHTGASMIEVPVLQVGGYFAGPVWFTVRSDRNFTEWMSQWTDKKVYGALGGSALQYFRVTIDYPSGCAYFERP